MVLGNEGRYLLNKGVDPRKRSPSEQSRIVFWGYCLSDFRLVHLNGGNADGHRENNSKKTSEDNEVGSNRQDVYIAHALPINVLAVNRRTDGEKSCENVNEIQYE